MKTERITIEEYLRNPTLEKYERMVEQGALAMYDSAKLLSKQFGCPVVSDPNYWRVLSRSHLASQGITPKKGRK